MSVPAVAAHRGVDARGHEPVAERATPRGRRAPVGQPGVGFSGIRFTWAASGRPRQRAASSAASLARSLTPSMSAHSKRGRRPLASR